MTFSCWRAERSILRTAWVYAASGCNFLRTMLRLMDETGSVRVVADQIGHRRRQHPWRRRSGGSSSVRRSRGTYHWTDSGVASWYDFAVAIAEEATALGAAAKPSSVTPIATSEYPTPARRPRFSVLDKPSDAGRDSACLRALAYQPARGTRGDASCVDCWSPAAQASSARNFVHHWLREHPGERVVVLDALTYAGNPRASRREGRPGVSFRSRRHLRHGAGRERCSARSVSTRSSTSRPSRMSTGRSSDPMRSSRQTSSARIHCSRRHARSGSRNEPCRRIAFTTFRRMRCTDRSGPSDPAFTETTPYAPNSPYSASKAASDHLVRAYHHTYGLDVTISNCSNNYGPYHFPEKLIPLMHRQHSRGRALPVYGDGRNIRDWLHVSDHCRGIEAILERGHRGRGLQHRRTIGMREHHSRQVSLRGCRRPVCNPIGIVAPLSGVSGRSRRESGEPNLLRQGSSRTRSPLRYQL